MVLFVSVVMHYNVGLGLFVLLLLCISISYATDARRIWANESHYWNLNTQKGIIRGQNLKLRKLNHPTNPYHTCYEVTCEGRQCIDRKDGTVTIQVCYPLLVVTGLPKCATSAMYDLLSKFPGAITMQEKENCPSTRRRPHWIYLLSLPRMSAVKEHSVIIDGCISVINNMKIRDLIHNPETYYIVSWWFWIMYPNIVCLLADGLKWCSYLPYEWLQISITNSHY